MEVDETLKELGLNEKEIKVYLATIQLSSSSVSRIASKSQIQRTTTYHVLKSLKEKGLVSFVTKDNRTFFEATNPQILINSLREKEKRLRSIIPHLNEIKGNSINKPKLTLYEGKKGLISILEDILNDKKDFFCYASKDALLNILNYYFPNFVERRVKAKINARLILDGHPIAKKLVDYRIVDKKFKTSTFIYGDKVAILSLTEREPIGVIIENPEIAQTQRIVFDIMWDKAER